MIKPIGGLRFFRLSLEGEIYMGKSTRDSRGFTLIAALLLTVLLSGIAVGLLYMVSNEERMGGNDLEGTVAFYGAESGIENLTLVTGSNITSMNYNVGIGWPTNNICTNGVDTATTNPTGNWDIVGSGADQGMVATLIPYTLT